MNNSVLITGCNGYIGAALSVLFQNVGCTVFGVSRSPLEPQLEPYVFRHLQCSVPDLDRDGFEPYPMGSIVHLAGSRISNKLSDDDYHWNNVQSTRHLKHIYPGVPIYLASTIGMYNQKGKIQHLHAYSRSKEEAEKYADASFRIGTVCGSNMFGNFNTIIDAMVDSVYKHNEITVVQSHKMRPLISLDKVCVAILVNVIQGWRGVLDLWTTVHSVGDIAEAVRHSFDMGKHRRNPTPIEVIHKTSPIDAPPAISTVPPDCVVSKYDAQLFSLVSQSIASYEKYVLC